MDVLVVVDMQVGLLQGDAKHDLSSVVERINRLGARLRARGGRVVFVQHDGEPGDDFEPFTSGWAFLPSLERKTDDVVVRKTLNDAFFGTPLEEELVKLGASRVFISGWATDLCVDATIRSAAALGFEVVAVSDCHTLSDRPHLSALQVIEHHQWVWTNVISRHPVRIVREVDL